MSSQSLDILKLIREILFVIIGCFVVLLFIVIRFSSESLENQSDQKYDSEDNNHWNPQNQDEHHRGDEIQIRSIRRGQLFGGMLLQKWLKAVFAKQSVRGQLLQQLLVLLLDLLPPLPLIAVAILGHSDPFHLFLESHPFFLFSRFLEHQPAIALFVEYPPFSGQQIVAVIGLLRLCASAMAETIWCRQIRPCPPLPFRCTVSILLLFRFNAATMKQFVHQLLGLPFQI